MKTKGKVIPKWLSKYLDTIENIIFLGRLEEFWHRLIIASELKPSEKVIDVGCGSGKLTLMIANKLNDGGEVIGVDASGNMINECNRNDLHKGYPVSFQLGLMEKLSFSDNYFDVVISSLAIHHVPRDVKVAAFKEFARVLKSGGRLLLLDHGKPYNLGLKFLLFPMRWNILEFQAENFRGEIPNLIKSVFHNVEEKDRFYGWLKIWKAIKKSANNK